MKLVRFLTTSAAVIVCLCVLGAFCVSHYALAGLPADPDSKVIQDNMQAKVDIAQDLIAKRISLTEAITGFRALDARRPQHMPATLPGSDTDSVEQRYARSVIDWALHLAADQSDSESVSTRLEGELREYLVSASGQQL
jgi:hypothetical protein